MERLDSVNNQAIYTAAAQGVGNVGDASGSEVDAQGAFYLGYLALLCNEARQQGEYGPQVEEELKRVYTLLQGELGQITDPTIKALVSQMLTVLGPNGAGSITSSTEAAFFNQWTTQDQSQSPVLKILNWLQSNQGYQFLNGGIGSPDTAFAAAMFVSSLTCGQLLTNPTVEQAADQFFSQGEGGKTQSPVYEFLPQFLCAYSYAHKNYFGPGVGAFLFRLAFDAPGVQVPASYADYAAAFEEAVISGGGWTPPPGQDPEATLDGYSYILQEDLETLNY